MCRGVFSAPLKNKKKHCEAVWSFHKPDDAPVDFQQLTRFGFVVTMRSHFLGLETINRPSLRDFKSLTVAPGMGG